MGALGVGAGLGMLAWYLSAFYVGGRLLRLGTRGDNPPARWIGIYLFCAMGLGSVLLSIPLARGALAGIPLTWADRLLVALGCSATAAGNIGILTFTRRVFRPESGIAEAAAFGIAALLVGGTAGHGLATGFDRDLSGTFAMLYLAGTVLTNAWASLESLRYYALMRRRLQIGLVEPLEANRFLLWGCGAGAAAIILLSTSVEQQVQTALSGAGIEALRRFTIPALSALGLACGGCYLFAFFPARWYVRRFAATAEGAA